MAATSTDGVAGQASRRHDVRIAVLATLAMTTVVLMMAISQGGPAYFVQLGDESLTLDLAKDLFGEDVPTPITDKHDGEYYWMLARDPTLAEGEDLAVYLDRPVYRAQRIGYPLLAAPWRVFGETGLLWGLVVTNLAVVAAGTYVTSRAAPSVGSRLAGYAFVANPVVWLSVLFDFADALALLGLVGACFAVRRGHSGAAAIAGVVATLAKESALLGLGMVALLATRAPGRARLAIVVPAGMTALGWRLYVVSRPGFGSDPQVEEFALMPFSGYEEAWRLGWSPMGHWLYAAIAIALIPIAVVVVLAWWRHRGSEYLAAALPYALIVPFLSGQVLDIPINSVRAIGPALTLAALGVMSARHRRQRSAAASR